MRTISRKAYKLQELRAGAKERAYSDYKDMIAQSGDIPWSSDTFDSLKALFEAAGVKMKDWEIGAYSYSSLRAEFGGDGEAGELKGARAMAWLENNLYGPLRASWGFPEDARRGKPAPSGYRREGHYRAGKYVAPLKGPLSRYTRPGCIPDCPLTGVSMDEDFMDASSKAVRGGETLREAFEGLADVCRGILEAEDEHQNSEEAFKEWAHDVEFYYDGERVR